MSSTARSDDWKKYDKNLNKSVALEDLRDSVRQQDEDKVEKAIQRCHDAGLDDNERVKEAGEIHLPVITARNKLLKACKELKDKGEDDGVKSELKSIKKDGLSPYLQMEVRDAKNLLDRHEKSKAKEKPKAVVLAMDSKTVAEIRRYQNPPEILRKVIQAALLLVGEDEDMTDSWKNCQRICNPYGNDGLCRKVVNFDPSKAHPEIVARAKEILQKIEFSDVQSVGRNAPVTFYVWAMGSIEKSEAAAEKESKGNEKKQKQEPAAAKGAPTDNKTSDKTSKADGKKDEEEAKPANRKRQKEIFGRLPPPHDDNNFYNMTVNVKKKPKGKRDGSPSKSTADEKPSKTKVEENSKTKVEENSKTKAEEPSKTKAEEPSKTKVEDPSKTKVEQQSSTDIKKK